MSLYEISDIVPGKSLMARDLIRGGTPVAVSEGTATKTLRQWDQVAARIVSVGDRNIFGGGLLPFSAQSSDTLFDALSKIFGKGKKSKRPVITDAMLKDAAPAFTMSWLYDTLERTMGMDRPSVENSDGDEIVFHNVQFPLSAGVTQKIVAERLNTVPVLRQENTKFWNWLGDIPKRRSKASKTEGQVWDTTIDDGRRVLGNVELNNRILKLSVNSAARAERGKVLLQKALGDLVRTPLTEIRTIDQMIADRKNHADESDGPELPPETARAAVHGYLDKHYRETLDQPIGMLGDISPREAVKTTQGREQTAAWLKYLENQTTRQKDPNDPMATYDFRWLWRELGIEKLRR